MPRIPSSIIPDSEAEEAHQFLGVPGRLAGIQAMVSVPFSRVTA